MAKLTSVSLNGNSSDVADAYSKSETDTLLAGKQDTLTPGSGINISSNNVISATGGSSVELFDNMCDSDGVWNTGGAITPRGLSRALYRYADGSKNLTGVMLIGPTPIQNSLFNDACTIEIGTMPIAESPGSIAIGGSPQAYNYGIAIGSRASAIENQTLGVPGGVAIGWNAKAAAGGISIGQSASTTGSGSDDTTVSVHSVAIGRYASSGYDGVAIGKSAIARDGSIALGIESVAIAGSVQKVVSVGHAAGDRKTYTGPGTYDTDLKRKIINVADGTNATDAVTKGQLDAAIAALQAQIDALRS